MIPTETFPSPPTWGTVATASTPALDAALLAAQIKLKPIAHDGVTPKYSFVSVDQYVATCRAALHGEGLLLKPIKTTISVGVTVPTEDRQTGVIIDRPSVASSHVWILSHPESGESVEIEGGAVSETDKGRALSTSSAACRSAALRDVLRELLMVVRGDASDFEPEAIESKPERYAGYDDPRPDPGKPCEAHVGPCKDHDAPRPDPTTQIETSSPSTSPASQTSAKTGPDLVDQFHAALGGPGPTAADLKEAGWVTDAPSAEQLEALPADAPVFGQIRKDLHRECVKVIGQDRARAAWKLCGWAGPQSGEPTGLQCREMARETMETYETLEADKHG